MSTMMEDSNPGRPAPAPVRNEELVQMPRCTRCNLSYMPGKSTSSLRLTYCSFLCELGHLGFSMAGLEHMVRKPVAIPTPDAEPEPEPALVS